MGNTCEICGADYEGSKCGMKKAHSRLKKMIALYGDVVQTTVLDTEAAKERANTIIKSDSSTEEELIEAYDLMVMSYFLRYQRQAGWTSLRYETYYGMLLKSCPEKWDRHPDIYNDLVEKYGLIYGLKAGCTYALEHEKMRYVENFKFRAYTASHGWVVTHKESGNVVTFGYKLLKKTVSEDYLFGYAHCYAVTEKW